MSETVATTLQEETPLFYTNYDLENVVTPVKVDILENMLKETGYDQMKTNKIIRGFKNGFSLGYEGPTNVQLTAPNLPLYVGNSTVLWNKIMKEVKLK